MMNLIWRKLPWGIPKLRKVVLLVWLTANHYHLLQQIAGLCGMTVCIIPETDNSSRNLVL